jgi:hypothetical protein
MRKMSRISRGPGPLSQVELGLFIEKISELVARDPRKAAIVLTDWMNQSTPPQTVKKDGKKRAG